MPRTAAGALFLDSAGAVLMVCPTYKSHWDIPGGFVEPGESPLAACVREVREELGIAPEIGRLLVVDWAPDDRGDKLLFVFDGGILTPELLGRLVLPPSELSEWTYQPLDRLPATTTPRLVRRLTAAITARAAGTTVYLEHGRPQDQQS